MRILNDIQKLKIMVVGDVMLDRYWWGSVNRISPEAPVPIVKLEKMSITPGGAANVAANLVGLGAVPYLFGVRGIDEEGELLTSVLLDGGIDEHVVPGIAGRKTTIKTRIVAHGQHVVRIDQETADPLTRSDADELLAAFDEVLPSMSAVIISDYAKGMVTPYLLEGLISRAVGLNKLIVVDPKGRDFARYVGASVITPNKREASEACALDPEGPDVVTDAGAMLMASLGLSALLVTEGEHGMTLFERSGTSHHLEPNAQEVYDVTGAGDTVIATFTAAAAAGRSFLEAAQVANAAAGIVIGQIGTTHITGRMLSELYDGDLQLAGGLHA